MKNKIKEVQDYFKSKILSGDFAVVKAEDIVVEIKIDEVFTFNVWSHKDIVFELYKSNTNFLEFGFTPKEQEQGFAIFNPIKAEAEAERLKTTDLKTFNDLKAKLEAAGVINQLEAVDITIQPEGEEQS